ncbi:MAG TPA: lysophospholipid acyltransferase family protein, partial [Gemmatimonadaceae bacterium]
HRLEYAGLRTAVAALSALRWRRASSLGGALGRLGYSPFGVRRRVVERQIAAAFPDWDAKRVAAVARGAYDHLGRLAVETALMPALGQSGVRDLVSRTAGWELLERACAEKRGAVLITGHFGNWELAGAYIAARGVPVDVIVRRMSNPIFDRYLNQTRADLGMAVVYDAEAVRRTTRSLKEGRAVGFLADQGVLNLASTYVPFFGRPAKTPRGPAVFTLRYHVPTLFVAAVRQPDGRFHLSFENVPYEETGDRERDVDGIVASYTRILEGLVRKTPEQYFWQHRRWKHQPADTPPALRDPAA